MKSSSLQRIALYSTGIVCVVVLIAHLISVLTGFLYTGDTISHLEYAPMGSPLTIFILHPHEWPPLTAIVFSFFKYISSYIIIQSGLFTILLFILNVVALYVLVRGMGMTKIEAFIATVFCLFSGIHSLLFHTAIAEQIFTALWFFSFYVIYRFFKTKKERYLMLFCFVGSMLPLARYIGLGALIWLCLCIAGFCFFYRKQQRVSWYLLITSLVLSLMPMLFYLFRTKVLKGSFFGPLSPSIHHYSLYTLIFNQIVSAVQDILLAGFVAFILGLTFTWKKRYSFFLFFIGTSVLYYQAGLVLSKLTYYIIDNFPSRFNAVSYPLILLTLLLLGSYVGSKISWIKKITPYVYIVFTVFILYSSISLIPKTYRTIPGIEYSGDINSICSYSPNSSHYLLIQRTSRNWVGQSLYYYCKHIKVIPVVSAYKMLKGDIVYTPYLLSATHFELMDTYKGNKVVYIYKVKQTFSLNVSEMFSHLLLLD